MKQQTCQMCGRGKAIQEHHYPIAKRHGGKLTIPLCADCHKLFHSKRGDFATFGRKGGKQTAKRTAFSFGGEYPNLKQYARKNAEK